MRCKELAYGNKTLYVDIDDLFYRINTKPFVMCGKNAIAIFGKEVPKDNEPSNLGSLKIGDNEFDVFYAPVYDSDGIFVSRWTYDWNHKYEY